MKVQNLCTFSKHILTLTDSANVANIIQNYAKTNQLKKAKQLHSQLITTGYPLCTYLTNHLINMYSKCRELDYAVKLFDKMPVRNLVSWTAMITGFSQNQNFVEAITTFCNMRIAQESPNQFAFSSVIRACVSLGFVEFGRQLHCLALKCGFGCELFVGSNLADMYSKCGVIRDACKVFEEMDCTDEVLWTAMIDGYAKNGDFEGALLVYKRMVNEGVVIDHYVLSSTLSACGALKASYSGKCLHSVVVRLGYQMEISVKNALTDMYSKVRDMEGALNVFEFDSEPRNIVSHTSLIDGYVEMDQIERAVNTFVELRRQGIEPNEFTFSSLIKGCANQAALDQGIQLHAQVIRFNFDRNPFVSSILVDMYGKCGLLDDSIRVFDDIDKPTEFAWNSLISVFAQHGLGKEALETLDRMIHRGVKPNAITFVSLLTGCSHAGLIDEGLNHFYSMEKTYGVVPREEHYSCVIDLLGRSGRLKEAEEFIKNMPFEPNAFGWCSFLGACRIHGDKERRKIVAEKLMQLEPENSGAHVLLSNIYAKEQQWKDVKKNKSFEAMTCRNVGSWNTMITGYAQSSEITLARNLFDRSPLDTIACDSVHFAVPVNDKIVLSVLIGQIVGTLGFGFKNVKTKGVRRRQWQIAWAFLACRWTIVLVPLWLWVALRRDFSIGVYHSHKPDMGLRSFIVQLVHFRVLNRTRGRVLFEEGVTDVGVIFYVGLGLVLSFILGLILCL